MTRPVSTTVSRSRSAEATIVACALAAEGPFDRIVDLLHVLSSQPFLSRIDSLRLSPRLDKDGKAMRSLAADVKFSVMILPARTGRVKPESVPPEAETILASESRKHWNDIVRRNIFLPYVPVPKPRFVRQPDRPRLEEPKPPPPPPSPSHRYKLIGGLATRADEFGLMDIQRDRKIRYYTVGDEMPRGGRAVLLDSVPRPNPNRDGRMSDWRIILRDRDEYWAVEAGEFLLQRHRIAAEHLPEELRVRVASGSGGSGGSG